VTVAPARNETLPSAGAGDELVPGGRDEAVGHDEHPGRVPGEHRGLVHRGVPAPDDDHVEVPEERPVAAAHRIVPVCVLAQLPDSCTIVVRTAGRCSPNQVSICRSSSTESSNRLSTRNTGRPSSDGGRSAARRPRTRGRGAGGVVDDHAPRRIGAHRTGAHEARRRPAGPCPASQRSASIAAAQPDPAAVTACR